MFVVSIKRSLPPLAAALLAGIVWLGCADEPAEFTEPGVQLPQQELFAPAIAAQERHTPRLLEHPDIVGTGVGLDASGDAVIRLYTRRPGVQGLPRTLDGIPVVEMVTGMFVARADPTARFPRPVPIGVSTGHPDITAGTIGARVTDGSNVFALSNNHIYANSNDANIGDSALQPGPFDGGQDPEDKIGELYDFEPIKFDGSDNTIDAAIAISSTSDLDVHTPDDGYGTPSATTTSASVGLKVQKYGRTTGWTHGEVSEVNVTVDVCYQCNGPFCFSCSKLARFVDQIAITPGDFSSGGDSGSLIVTDDASKDACGLLFAGSDTRTLANPIDAVLTRFGITIDDGSGGGTTNSPPTASFTHSCTDLTCDFDGSGSSDSDGSISSYDWDFGDGNTGTGVTVSHTYASDGTYTVTLTVTDDDGATDSSSQDVTVSSSGGGITLSATGYKVRGLQKADLEWSGATSTDVDVYRDGALLVTTENDGFYTDDINNRGSGSYTYQVCEAGTSTCSNEATVTF